MKAALSWLLVLAGVIAGGAYLVNLYYSRWMQQAYWVEIDAAKQDFLQKSTALGLVDDGAYKQEVLRSLADYFKAIREVGNKFPKMVDFERERKQGEKDVAEGKLSEAQRLAREERITYTLELFNKMKEDKYRPLYTNADKTFRFDIYDMSRAKISGQDRIKIAFVHWGAFGPVDYSHIEGQIHTQEAEGAPLELKKFEADSQPPTLQVRPEQWVREFIPGVEIGYYDLPLFPQDATAVDLSFDFNILTPGRLSIPAHIAFKDIPVPDSWKLGAGQKWTGTEERIDEEQLRAMKEGTEPAAEPPPQE